MMEHSLTELGWSNHFAQQLTLEEWDNVLPARIAQQHKSQLQVLTEHGPLIIHPLPHNNASLAVGDWLLLNTDHSINRVLERASVFSRKAPGSKLDEQLIASNVDTLLIVTSFNQDFNLNRLERYLVMACDAQVEPVVVITKSDLCTSPEMLDDYQQQVQSLNPLLMVVSLNALDKSELHKLAPWCKQGKTLALLGSSGVGKSTLANMLLGQTQQTGHIREDDAKGRHTTTARSLHVINKQEHISGGLLLDTPGMRELQLANSEAGIEGTFSDIIELAQHCKFNDCQHQASLTDAAGCAVQKAIKIGVLNERRLLSYQKLQREDALNSASLSQRRAQDKKFGKMIHSVINDAHSRKNR